MIDLSLDVEDVYSADDAGRRPGRNPSRTRPATLPCSRRRRDRRGARATDARAAATTGGTRPSSGACPRACIASPRSGKEPVEPVTDLVTVLAE